MSEPLKRAQVAEELVAMHPAALDCTRAETVTHLLSDLMHHCVADRVEVRYRKDGRRAFGFPPIDK